jgi:hypothetical protein
MAGGPPDAGTDACGLIGCAEVCEPFWPLSQCGALAVRYRFCSISRWGRCLGCIALDQVLQVDAAVRHDDHARKEVGEHGFLHVHARGLGGLQRHMQAAQVQRFPGQQVLTGRQRVGAEFFQRHIARHLCLRAGRQLAVGDAALEAGVGAQQFDVQAFGQVRLKGLQRQPVDHQPALRLDGREAQAAVEVDLAGFKPACGQAQGRRQRHGLGGLGFGGRPVVQQQAAQLGLDSS